jgi:hypothetical protein
MIVEINSASINGILPKEAWTWFYIDHHEKQPELPFSLADAEPAPNNINSSWLRDSRWSHQKNLTADAFVMSFARYRLTWLRFQPNSVSPKTTIECQQTVRPAKRCRSPKARPTSAILPMQKA